MIPKREAARGEISSDQARFASGSSAAIDSRTPGSGQNGTVEETTERGLPVARLPGGVIAMEIAGRSRDALERGWVGACKRMNTDQSAGPGK